MSPQISARVFEELNDRIEVFSTENDYSKSEAVRTLLDRGFETEALRTENKRLREQLAATNQRIDEANESLAGDETTPGPTNNEKARRLNNEAGRISNYLTHPPALLFQVTNRYFNAYRIIFRGSVLEISICADKPFRQ